MWVAYEMLLTLCRSFAHTHRDTGVSVRSRRHGRTSRAVGNSDASAHALEARKHVRAVASDEAKRRCNPRVYMRYSPIPTPKHRIWYKGQAYQIRGVVDIEERRQWLELRVEQGVPT